MIKKIQVGLVDKTFHYILIDIPECDEDIESTIPIPVELDINYLIDMEQDTLEILDYNRNVKGVFRWSKVDFFKWLE